MGFAIAERAAARGARAVLVAGPVSLATPPRVERVDVRTALEMQAALDRALLGADALVMAAAVSDYRPASAQPQKIKKTGDAITLDLVKNPDLLATIGKRRTGSKPVLVGFALETAEGEALVAYARRKLMEKKVDLVVANAASDGFGGDRNRAVLVAADREEALEEMSKRELADRLLDRVLVLSRETAKAAPTGAATGGQPC
jgi:phosphopantothenoylcysteine decarboxylase/phosphopantothenate--cysteine ligase